MFKKAGIIPTCEPLSLNLTKLVSFEQGGKCRDISAIYRRNIVCRRVSTRYFLEKYRSSDFSAFIARNRRFLAIYRWFGDKSAIFLWYIAWSTRVNESQTRYSARQRATVLLQCLPFCLLLRGFEPQTKRFGVHPLTTWAK